MSEHFLIRPVGEENGRELFDVYWDEFGASLNCLERRHLEALCRALGQHLGVEPLPGWRWTEARKGGSIVWEDIFYSGPTRWCAEAAVKDDAVEYEYRPTALEAMRAVEELAGKEKPE
jgi:hypothetical protein